MLLFVGENAHILPSLHRLIVSLKIKLCKQKLLTAHGVAVTPTSSKSHDMCVRDC
jgi:hypothetical protein